MLKFFSKILMQLLISLTLLLTCSHIWLIFKKNSALIWCFFLFRCFKEPNSEISKIFFQVLKSSLISWTLLFIWFCFLLISKSKLTQIWCFIIFKSLNNIGNKSTVFQFRYTWLPCSDKWSLICLSQINTLGLIQMQAKLGQSLHT